MQAQLKRKMCIYRSTDSRAAHRHCLRLTLKHALNFINASSKNHPSHVLLCSSPFRRDFVNGSEYARIAGFEVITSERSHNSHTNDKTASQIEFNYVQFDESSAKFHQLQPNNGRAREPIVSRFDAKIHTNSRSNKINCF